MRDLTWTCYFCGDERPDDRISVVSHETPIGPYVLTENRRYCNDRRLCRVDALTWLDCQILAEARA